MAEHPFKKTIPSNVITFLFLKSVKNYRSLSVINKRNSAVKIGSFMYLLHNTWLRIIILKAYEKACVNERAYI